MVYFPLHSNMLTPALPASLSYAFYVSKFFLSHLRDNEKDRTPSPQCLYDKVLRDAHNSGHASLIEQTHSNILTM